MNVAHIYDSKTFMNVAHIFSKWTWVIVAHEKCERAYLWSDDVDLNFNILTKLVQPSRAILMSERHNFNGYLNPSSIEKSATVALEFQK